MAELDLAKMLASLTVTRRDGEFVFVNLGSELPSVGFHALIQEIEGITAVLSRADADAEGYEYNFVGAWLTLDVFSALEAVGLAAAVSASLAAESIPANIIAGFHHDHIVVPIGRADDAVRCIEGLRTDSVA